MVHDDCAENNTAFLSVLSLFNLCLISPPGGTEVPVTEKRVCRAEEFKETSDGGKPQGLSILTPRLFWRSCLYLEQLFCGKT